MMPRFALLVAALLFAAESLLGQAWVVEQVDSTAADGSPVELVKAADGRLWTCYQTTSGLVRVACLGDTGWSITDIGPGIVREVWRSSMAAGPHGELCLSCYSQDSGWFYRLAGDSWQSEPFPFMNQSRLSVVAYDTAGRLHTAYGVNVSDFWAGTESDSGWVAELALQLFVTGWVYGSDACFTVAADGSPWYFAYVWWEMSQYVWGDEVALAHLVGDTWRMVWGESGQNVPIPLALVPHDSGVGRVSVGHGTMFYDREQVASVTENSVAGLAYSSEGIPLVAWVPRYSSALPIFAFKTNRWHVADIPGPAGTGGIDIETDAAGEPVVVYSTPDRGLWSATGTDVVGAEENPAYQVPSHKLEPTVIRSLPPGAVAFDASGRRVVNPKSGIYFVRAEPSAVDRKPSAVTKVIITR